MRMIVNTFPLTMRMSLLNALSASIRSMSGRHAE
jgi:hypothetical protein